MEPISLQLDPALASENMHIREAFRFVFKGYSIWLELGQTDRDLEKAVASASLDNSLCPIPAPHCTVLYGVSHMSEEEARLCFREKVVPAAQHWPALETKGSHVGVTFDGVDGEEIDMAWMELTLKSSIEHEKLVENVHDCFYHDSDAPHYKERHRPWKPHISIAYDNPEESTLDDISAEKIFAKFPTLLGRKRRNVKSISLWRTKGKLWEWECLDKVQLCEN